MTKTSKTIITILIAIFLIIVAATYAYVASQLDTKELRLNVIQKIEKTFPNVKASLGEFNVEFGQSLELKTDSLKINLKDNTELLDVGLLTIKVPIFSILLGGGNVEIDIDRPKFFYRKKEEGSNWSLGLRDHKINELIHIDRPEEILLPAFLANSTLAIRLNSLELIREEEKIEIKKFVLKNLGLNSNAAFELKTDFNYILENNDNLVFSTFIVGSIDLSAYLETKSLPFKTSYRLDGIAIKGREEMAPRLNGNLEGSLSKDGSISIKNSARLERSNFKHNILIDSKKILIDEIVGNLALSELNPFISYKNIPLTINSGDLNIKGSLLFESKRVEPKIEVTLDSVKGTIPGSNYNASGELKLTEEKWGYKALINMFDGSTSIEGNADIQLNEGSSLEEKIIRMNSIIKMADLKLNSEAINEFITGTSEEVKTSSLKWPFLLVIPNSTLDAEMVNSKWDEKLFGLNLSVKTKDLSTQLEKMEINFDKGSIKATGDAGVFADGINSRMKINLNNFDTAIVRNLIDPMTPFLIGEVSGLVEGPISVKDSEEIYDLKVSLNSKSGVLVGIDLDKEFKSLRSEIEKLPIVGKGIEWKKKDITNRYKNASLDMIVKDGKIEIKKMKINTEDNNLKINSSGKISLDDNEESLIEGTLIDDLGIKDYLKKNFAMKSVPFALKGKGRKINIDESYTMDKFMGHLKGKEGKAQVEKTIDANVDKYIKGENGKKIKSLLKGLLK